MSERAMSSSAEPSLPASRWASLFPSAMRTTTELAFDNGVLVRRFVHQSYDAPDMPACEQHLFAYRLAGTVTAERKLGSVWQRAVTRRGSITTVPALRGTSWRLQGAGEVLHFYLPPSLLRDIGEEVRPAGAEPPIVEHLGAFDPEIGNLVETFVLEVQNGIVGFDLYAEAVTTQLAVCLVRGHAARARGAGRALDGLRRPVEERLREYVEANLQHDMSLSELAALADLGPAQFTKRFRVSFGMPPYRYVLHRRVELAKTLLSDGGLGIAQVAVAVGFAHQAHFTTAFRRLCGTTPAAYRAASRA